MENEIFAIGSYTEKAPHVPHACGEGISILSLNDKNGQLARLGEPLFIPNPSYLEWEERAGVIFAVTEDEESSGQVTGFALHSGYGLQKTESRKGPGRAACHVAVNEDRKRLYAVSYTDGILKGYPLADGNLKESDFEYRYSGNGPNKVRQISSHVHQVLPVPGTRYLYISDLGSDIIWKHDPEKQEPEIALHVPPGYGPRHLAFDPQSRCVFILCELVSRLLVARIQPASGIMTILQDLDTTGGQAAPPAAPAAVKVHPSGKTVAVSNRFSDTIAVFGIHRKGETASLELRNILPSCGKTPRDIAFSRSGRWLLIANQDSSSIGVMEFDPNTGEGTEAPKESFGLGTPVCICSLGH